MKLVLHVCFIHYFTVVPYSRGHVMITSHLAPTSTRPTNSPQVGHHPTSLPTCPTKTFAVVNCCLFSWVSG